MRLGRGKKTTLILLRVIVIRPKLFKNCERFFLWSTRLLVHNGHFFLFPPHYRILSLRPFFDKINVKEIIYNIRQNNIINVFPPISNDFLISSRSSSLLSFSLRCSSLISFSSKDVLAASWYFPLGRLRFSRIEICLTYGDFI